MGHGPEQGPTTYQMFRMMNVAVLCDEARESSKVGLSVCEELGLHRESVQAL